MRKAPFVLVYDSTPTMTALAAPSSSHAMSFAMDVNDDANPKIAGMFGPATTSPCDVGSTSDCGAPFEPITWRQSASTIILPVLALSTDPMKDQALAVNDSVDGAYDIVGFSSKHPCDPPEEFCRNHAAVWRVPTSESVVLLDLHEAADPPLDCGDNSVAHALTNRDVQGRMQVVGKSSAQNAVRWSRDENGDWTKEVLIDLVCSPYQDWWDLNRPYDITDDGWIVGRGKFCGNSGYDAFILVPVEECPCDGSACEGDLNCDGIVNGVDLAILLGEWGATCSIANLDDDDDVDGQDLAILLGNWGPCSSFSSSTGHPGLAGLIEILIDLGHEDLAALLQSVWADE